MSSDRRSGWMQSNTRWSRSLDAHVDDAKLDAGWDRVRARREAHRATFRLYS